MTEDLATKSPEHKLLDVALELADDGTPVFPVGRNKMPCWSNKALGVEKGQGGFKIATTDPDRIEYLFSHKAATGIGMPTGKITKVTVIDVDCGKGKKSRDSAIRWLDANRDKLRGADVVRTGSGGLQYYCAYTKGIPNAGNVWADGVDCRNDGGFVVIPPFMGYSFERQIDPDDWNPPPIPPKTVMVERPQEEYGGDTPEHVKDLIRIMNAATSDDMGWHTAAVRLTAHLVGSGWSDAEILRQACQWTKGGYTHRETFEDLCVMIAGARAKWERKNAPQDSEQARVDRMAALWARCKPDTRKALLKAWGKND